MDLAKTIDLKELLLAQLPDLTNTGNETEYLSERRTKALKSFENSGFPTTKHEEYKYFNLSKILKEEFRLAEEKELDKSDVESFFFNEEKCNRLVFVNGQYSKQLSSIVDSEDVLQIKKIDETEGAILEKYFAKEIYSSNDPFAELNTALAQHGVYIHIPKNKVVEYPVFLHFFSDASDANTFIQNRNLIIAEENSQVTVTSTYHTLGEHISFLNEVTEIILQENANVTYYKLQDDNPKSVNIGGTTVTLEGKSVFNSGTITLNGAMVRNNLNVILNAEYSEANFYGLYFTKDRQLVDNHTMVDHAVPNCESNELYKGIIDDKSTGVFNGKIFVKQDAQKTNAFQSNKNILLTKDATMNTKPQLEIFADDVKCSHGATIGQLEEEPLFYLRSRGIGEDSAKAMLLVAFAQDVIDYIKIDALKEYLSKAIQERLSR